MEAPQNIQVEDIKDLARLVASTVSMGQPIYVLHFQYKGKHYLGVFGAYNHYYEKQGMPLFYYYMSEQPSLGKYIMVKMDEREEVTFSDGIKPGWIAVPIINLKGKPEFVEI